MRQGMTDPINHNTHTGDEMIGLIHTSGQLLIPGAISPLGNLGPLLRHFLYGTKPSMPYNFPPSRPNAAIMYNLISKHPCPNGIVPLAKTTWLKNKPKSQHFYGGSYTCPTPLEYIQQQLGLAICKAAAIHIREATHGRLLPPDHPTEDDHMPPTNDIASVQPQPGFLSTPPRQDPANLEAPRVLRHDFVNPASLWDPRANDTPVTALFGSLVDENSNNNSRSIGNNNDDEENDLDLDLFHEDSDNALFNDPENDDENDDDDDPFVDPIRRTMHPLDGPHLRRLV